MGKGIAIAFLLFMMLGLLYLLFVADPKQREDVVGSVSGVVQSGTKKLKSAADGVTESARSIHDKNGKEVDKKDPPLPVEPKESLEARSLLKRIAAEGRDDTVKTDADNRVVELRLFSLDIQDADMPAIGSMDRVEVLLLNEAKISNKGLFKLTTLDRLRELDLEATKITGVGLMSLRKLKIERLVLRYNKGIRDGDGRILAGFTSLKFLDISETNIGDKGFMALAGLRHLKEVHIYNSPILPGTVEKFQRVRPKVKIKH
jgi:hypothetical protein